MSFHTLTAQAHSLGDGLVREGEMADLGPLQLRVSDPQTAAQMGGILLGGSFLAAVLKMSV